MRRSCLFRSSLERGHCGSVRVEELEREEREGEENEYHANAQKKPCTVTHNQFSSVQFSSVQFSSVQFSSALTEQPTSNSTQPSKNTYLQHDRNGLLLDGTGFLKTFLKDTHQKLSLNEKVLPLATLRLRHILCAFVFVLGLVSR